ncbi:MAG: acyltransferase [Muribaculaceae bacterium]|nr:acyltransferase [Muribaculaceae bacterium]
MTSQQKNNTSGKLLWLSIAQGWAILLVVIGHVNGFTYAGDADEMYTMSFWIHRFCYSFHMPLFMFVSGGLLYYSRISKGWSTSKLYVDKLQRLALPFVLFTIVAFCIKGALRNFTKRGLELSVDSFFAAFYDPINGPLMEMWFIGTLMWLMLLYPVYRLMLKNVWTELVLLAITLVPFIVSLDLNVAGWFNLRGVPKYAFFFVAGILFFKYDAVRVFRRSIWAAIGCTALYAAAFLIAGVPDIVTAIFGILMSLAWAVRIADVFPGLFGSFRDHSFQIFLVGIFPQMAVELLVWRKVHHEWLQLPYYLVSCVAAICISIALSKAMRRCPVAILRSACGLK